jgi:VCBS repeat-containing protein
MFVVSRVESGGEGKAVVALLPQVIGNIQSAFGCGTLRRASGIAVQVMVDDPVCQGDVIETAADGRIGIRFIDGTVFNLSPGTRVAMNEFVCDSTGVSHSALFRLTRGSFAFIAGQVAKSGCLRIDTPLGSIRGRANAGGVGMLSLTALIFSAMKEVQAADPNVMFLDDGSITYKDLAHGSFELVTKEAVPRHFFIEDPGKTIVLHAQGSSVSVNQVTNSPARMAELQAAQQDALATYEKGLGSTGSSTPPLVNPLPVQPINFNQTNGSTLAPNSIEPAPWIFLSVPEMIVGKLPPPPPTLNAVTGPIEIDTVTFDVFAATSGTFVASSPNSGAALTYGISGGISGSTMLDGVTYDVSKTGPYGTLYVNSTAGAYIFVPDGGAINALKALATTSFTVTVSDGTLSANQTFTITINGTNDAAIISGATTGSVIEAGGVANATPGTPTATGTLTDIDVDDAPNTFTAVTSPTASARGYGTFTMTAAGVWTYTLNNANSAVQALNVGNTLTDSFTVTTIDGTAKMVTVTITGSNDAAIISGTVTGAVIEAGTASPGTPTAIGTLIDTDVDNPPNSFTAVSSPTASTGGYGTFTMTAAGVWTYTLNNTNSAVQALDAGSTLTDSFTVTTIDGTAKVVTVTITGSNDAAIISGTVTGAVTEAGTASPGTPTAIGTLTDTDVDNAANAFAAVTSPTASAGGYGTFTMTAAGVWTYALNNANGAVQALNVGDKLTDSFTVTTVDGTAQVVTVTINGSNDAAIISGTTTGSVVEIRGVVNATPGTQTATGTLTDTDLDNPPNTFTAVSSPTPSAGRYGTFTMTAAGVWIYTLDDTNSSVQALNVGDTLTDTFTVSSIDGTPQVVTITIHGPLVGATGTAPSLTLSESHLTATALDDNIAGSAPNATLTTTSGNFSTAFTSVQGVDGATISYALSIAGGSGTASGLIDSHTGQADVLVLNGNTIEGHVGTTGGTLAFTVQLDPTTGVVTFTEYRAVTQPFGTNPDGGEGVSLTAGIVNLTATITERDGDFQTASIDLGSRLTITDDGPTIGGFDEKIIDIVAGENRPVTAAYDGSFGADGDGTMRVAIHDGAVNGYNLATTDLGGGITSVHVTGNGDDYTFYYTTHAVSGGVELDAFFNNTSGTLSDAFFTLLINPGGTYTFDIESVGFLQQTTVSGSDFGASGSGQPTLTSPDGHLIITGDFNGGPANVKASSNGIAVGDTGLQMDQQETLLLKFTQEQPNVSFMLTQWQGNGTADVVVKVRDGATDIHDFTINIPKSSVDPRIVVEKTSNLALVNTQTFDSATSTYTLYVGSEFDQIGVSYDHAVIGNTTFTVNNITYDQRTTVPSTDLLFDVTAVDRDGDSSSASLQVDLQGSTNVASGLALSSTPSADALVGDSGNATLTDPFMATTISGTPQAVTTTNATAIISGTTTGFVLEAGGASSGTPTGTLTNTDVDKTPNTFTTVSLPTASDRGYGTFTMTAAGVWTYTLDNANMLVDALDVGDTLTDTFALTTVDGTAQVVTSTIQGSSDADPNDFNFLATGTHEMSDSAFVDGTSGGDGIEGAGREGQIIYGGAGHDTINGTGNSDIHNDTSNGDGGNDTIYGGSDTIHSNNGGDTIIGGFGSDLLKGSNGDDRFVYLSVADSNAAQFDVISDFKSGSDRINLTALGALGLSILALTSTSTSVPAHTIAWIYDSAANETIVYVNPTDQTLSIGDSGLLEIHLQGIVSVAASDFVYDAATASTAVAGEPIDLALFATAENDEAIVTMTSADASSDGTVSVGTLLTDGNWTVRTVGEHDRFVFSSDGEARTYSTESTNDDAAITTPTNEQSIEVQQVNVTAPTSNNLALDQKLVLDATLHVTNFATPSNDIAAAPQVGPGSHTESHSATHSNIQSNEDHGQGHDHNPPTVNDVAIANGAHSHASHASSNIGPDFEALEVQEDNGNHHSISGELNKHDTASKHGAPDSEPSMAHVASGSAAAHAHGLGDSFHFKEISTPEASDVVEDIEVDPIAASTDHSEKAVDPNGPPTISEIAQLIELSPPEHHPSDNLSHGLGHMGNVHAHGAHDLMV